jgi:hypothetical protein
MAPDLTTTNVLLGIMAVVSLLEALLLVGLCLGGILVYRRAMQAIGRIEERHVAPAAARINAVLDDVKGVTTIIREAAEDVDGGARRGLGWVLRHVWPRRGAA